MVRTPPASPIPNERESSGINGEKRLFYSIRCALFTSYCFRRSVFAIASAAVSGVGHFLDWIFSVMATRNTPVSPPDSYNTGTGE